MEKIMSAAAAAAGPSRRSVPGKTRRAKPSASESVPGSVHASASGSVKVAVRRLRAATASLDLIETEYERSTKANRSLSNSVDALKIEREALARDLKAADQRIEALEKCLIELSSRVDNALKLLHDLQKGAE